MARMRSSAVSILALGLCASCYSMKLQDEKFYGGLRERCWTETGAAGAFLPRAVSAWNN
jgi:hypothetical protein